MGARLSVRNVRHRRGGREVLRVDGLDVGPGEHLCVLGPNGAGKTTLLRLLAGVETPDHGRVSVDGVGTAGAGVALRRRVAYATQQPGLLSTSVRRNVELPLRWRKVPRRQRGPIALAALERLRVAHLADRPAGALSGGERQRVNLARALALDPAVLLLDEPAAGLDASSRSAFLGDLEHALADRATTVVQVSHRAEEAFRLADRVVVLVDGGVHQTGSPDVLNRSPADVHVASLLGYHNLVDAHVSAEGDVIVAGEPTGLTGAGPGPVTVAVFAGGVRLLACDHPGLSLRVRRVTPGPGFHAVRLAGAVSLLAHVPATERAPEPGDEVSVLLEPGLSAVLQPPRPPAEGPAPAPQRPRLTASPTGR